MFIWVGLDSNKFEKNGAYKRADQYIQALKDGRNKDVIQISEITPMNEPPMFKVAFPNWSDNYAK